MSNRGLNLFNNTNIPNPMQSLGQSPVPLRGLERFVQKRGMGPISQGVSPQGEVGNFSHTLKVQVPPEKSGGIKAFLSRFSLKRK